MNSQISLKEDKLVHAKLEEICLLYVLVSNQ